MSGEKLKKIDAYFPLRIGIFYLIGTIFLFQFGPIYYYVERPFLLYGYLSFYLACACLGYFFGVKKARFFQRVNRKKIFKINFWILLTIAFFSAIIINMNYAKLPSLYPSNIIDALLGRVSIFDIGVNYYKSHESSEYYSGNKYLNALNMFLAWTKAVLIGFMVFEWGRLTPLKRIFGVCVIFIPVLSAILVGTNKPVFDLVLILAVCLWIRAYMKKLSEGANSKFSKKIMAVIVIFVLGIAGLFSQAMSQRGASAAYVEYTSMRGDIRVQIDDDSGMAAFYVIATHYLVQGYYGLGLALQEPFSSTYGFGHSKFLIRQASMLDASFAERTYQRKVSDIWHSDRQWHSAFSEFANDVHFVGVGVVMAILFFWIAVTWNVAVKFGYREALYLMPLHAMMVFFLPANNQIFGFIDSLSAYVFLSLLILSRANVFWRRPAHMQSSRV